MTNPGLRSSHVANHLLEAYAYALASNELPTSANDPLLPVQQHLTECAVCRQTVRRFIAQLMTERAASPSPVPLRPLTLSVTPSPYIGKDHPGIIYAITRKCRIHNLDLVSMEATAVRVPGQQGLWATVRFEIRGENQDIASANLEDFIQRIPREAATRDDAALLRIDDPHNVTWQINLTGPDRRNLVVDYLELMQFDCRLRVLKFNAKAGDVTSEADYQLTIQSWIVLPKSFADEVSAKLRRWADTRSLAVSILFPRPEDVASEVYDPPLPDGPTETSQDSLGSSKPARS